jgi:hypothetical protein
MDTKQMPLDSVLLSQVEAQLGGSDAVLIPWGGWEVLAKVTQFVRIF